MTPQEQPVDTSELQQVLKEYNWSSDRDYQIAVIACGDFLAAQKQRWEAEAIQKELQTIHDSRNIQVEEDGYVWCDFCHMMLEDSDQDCACLIIETKRAAALDGVIGEADSGILEHGEGQEMWENP